VIQASSWPRAGRSRRLSSVFCARQGFLARWTHVSASRPPLVLCLPQSRERRPGLDFLPPFLLRQEERVARSFALALPRSRSLPRTASSSVAVFSPARARAPFWASPAGCPRQNAGPWLQFSGQRSLLGSASVERRANPFLAVFFRSGPGALLTFFD
jgi:hypothetical protein